MVLLRTSTVALIGNPNTGKTTLFNALAGMRQRVGNYPGVTVETKKGQMLAGDEVIDLIDLPGTYSLAPRSPDEMVAVDVILGQQKGEPRPDAVVDIVDASNLERNLYLTSQAIELGVPVIVALNMLDVAESQGIRIDAARLSRQLGVPVVPIQANKGRGLEQLKAAIADRANRNGEPAEQCPSPGFPEAFEREAVQLRDHLGGRVPSYLVRRLLLDVGGYTERRLAHQHGDLAHDVQTARQRLADAGCPVPAVEARTRYGWIRQAVAGCVQRPDKRPITWTDRLDRVLTHKLWGTLIFLVLMFLVFQAIFTWARPLMKLISDGKDALADLLRGLLPAGPFSSLLIDGGLEGVGSVIVFLPQILILFGFVAILEDCGYMARAAFLMDKLMARCGLSGKSFIPMLSSVACAVPGIMATRVIENRRDRLATILVAPLMSCSARLPVYILLIGAFLTTGFAWWVPGLTMFCMYAIGLVVAPLVALALKRTLLRGETPVFVMEMPLYKWPSWRTVLRRMSDSGWAFIRRAGTIILATMVIVWALLYFPSRNAEGVAYSQLIADTLRPVEEQKKRLEELEKGIAKQQKELDRLDRLAEKGETETTIWTLYGLLGPSAAGREVERDARRAQLQTEIEPVQMQMKPLKVEVDPVDDKVNELTAEWKKSSWLGQAGRAIEPVVKPLGWDWRIGVAALASFPAREVVVGTLGIVYKLGKVDSEEVREGGEAATTLGKALQDATWDDEPERKVFTVPAALSLMVFFALCCQCASTLAVIRRETNSWRWPAFTFAYMTVLAYVGAFVVYRVGVLFV
jgi:ferrous iron transport protein B